MADMEPSKDKILKVDEETSRLKSKEIQLAEGDNNRKLFQNYANYSNVNRILELKDENGTSICSKGGLEIFSS